MREAIRCFISCILPCGALDVVRIVHVNGRVEEISRAVRAEEVMQAYPMHVLRKPPSASSDAAAAAPKGPVVLPPSAQLQKGGIYFLVPVVAAAGHEKAPAKKKKKRREQTQSRGGAAVDAGRLLASDHYLSEILAEKADSTAQSSDRRRGRVGVWRPRLESISEISNDF